MFRMSRRRYFQGSANARKPDVTLLWRLIGIPPLKMQPRLQSFARRVEISNSFGEGKVNRGEAWRQISSISAPHDAVIRVYDAAATDRDVQAHGRFSKSDNNPTALLIVQNRLRCSRLSSSCALTFCRAAGSAAICLCWRTAAPSKPLRCCASVACNS